MKTISFVAISVSVVLFFFSTTASASDWGDFEFSGHGGFTGNVFSASEAYGSGYNQASETYSVHEQTGGLNINALRTIYGSDTCQGTCDQNATTVQFELMQNVSAGAMHQAEGSGYAESGTNSTIQGSFDFGGTLKGFGE